jgi:ATP-dependent Clp protease ATP-binding subunit ClpB
VQDPLAELILAGDIKDGETVPVHAGPMGLMIGDVTVSGTERPSHHIAA